MTAPGAFDRAVALTREAIDAAAAGQRVALIAFDDRAEVVAAPGGRDAARAALRELRPLSGSTRYGPVFTRAAELAEQGNARLVVVSDLQRAGWEEAEPALVPAGIRLELRDSGAVSANLAISRLHHESDAVVATIVNTGAQPAATTAGLLLDGRQVASAAVSVPASGSVDVRISHRTPARGAASVALDDSIGYAADNVRHLVLDTDVRPRLLVVTSDGDQSGFYLTRAIQAATGNQSFDVRARTAPGLGTLPPDEMKAQLAVMLLSTRGLDRRARDMLAGFVQNGGGLWIAASPDVDPAGLAAILGWPDFSAAEQPASVVLAATDVRHPIFRTFGSLSANFGQVRFTRTWQVRSDGWDVVARFTDGSPALLERRLGDGRIILFASDVDRRWNDFPLHPAFVPFALESLRHLTASADVKREYLVAEAPRGAKPEPGVYTLEPGARRVAVNVDVRESTTTRIPPDEFRAMLRPVESGPTAPAERHAQQVERRQNLWRYGLLLMMFALVGESVLGRVR